MENGIARKLRPLQMFTFPSDAVVILLGLIATWRYGGMRMTIIDRIRPPHLASVVVAPDEDLREAEALIADLTALMDAGLVVARRQLGGSTRYEVIDEDGDGCPLPAG